MAVIYGSNESMPLKNILPLEFSLPASFAFLSFVLLYPPCIAAIAAMRKEFGSKILTFSVISYQIILAWAVSALVFQIFNFSKSYCAL
jgi:ferrous iron transport protein B